MEALGVGANVIAVVSIAFQLADSVNKLVEFWKSVRDAPADVSALFHDLDLLAKVLERSRKLNQLCSLEDYVNAALHSCHSSLSRLWIKIQRAEFLMRSECKYIRKWASFKYAFKSREVENIRNTIEIAKSTLQLVQQNTLVELVISSAGVQKQTLRSIESVSNVIRQRKLSRERNINASSDNCITEGCSGRLTMKNMELPAREAETGPAFPKFEIHLPTFEDVSKLSIPSEIMIRRPLIKNLAYQGSWQIEVHAPLYKVYMQHQTHKFSTTRPSGIQESIDTEITSVFYPNASGRLLGVTYGLLFKARSITGWKFAMEPFRAVREDSLVFALCQAGNLDGVKLLFQRGEASLVDRDPQGRTPLWVAASSLQLGITKFLLEEGADPHADDWRFHQPPIHAVAHSANADIELKLAVMKALQSYRTQDYRVDTLQYMAGRQLMFYRPQKQLGLDWAERSTAISAAFFAILRYLPAEDIQNDARTEIIWMAIHFCHAQHPLQLLLTHVEGRLLYLNGKSIIHESIFRRLFDRDARSMRMIVQRTDNLHLAYSAPFWVYSTPHTQLTPTMLAMYDRSLFLSWCSLLQDLGHNLETFAREEWSLGLFADHGWLEAPFFSLFTRKFPSDPHEYRGVIGLAACERCGNDETGHSSGPMVDIKWRRELRDIRRRKHYRSRQTGDIVTRTSINITGVGEDRLSPMESQIPTIPVPIFMERSDWPYRIVCSRACSDGVCVAWCYDNDDPGEPELPLVNSVFAEPVGHVVNVAVRDVEGCPSANMPGAFKD